MVSGSAKVITCFPTVALDRRIASASESAPSVPRYPPQLVAPSSTSAGVSTTQRFAPLASTTTVTVAQPTSPSRSRMATRGVNVPAVG